MIRHRSARLGVLFALVACGSQPEPERDFAAGAASVAAVTPPDSAVLAAATAVLDQFLDASREGALSRAVLERLSACPGETNRAQGPMLAAYDVLPPTTRADTIVGRAVVTTVAEQDLDRVHPGHFIARLRVRRDTLEWDVLRLESGEWVVCNGLRFGFTTPDSLTTWRPRGASAAAARALAESLGTQR